MTRVKSRVPRRAANSSARGGRTALSLVTVLALAGLVGTPSAASAAGLADPPSPQPSTARTTIERGTSAEESAQPSTAASAQAQADQVAAQVRRLTAVYRDRQASAARAAQELAAAFAVAGDAEASRTQADVQVREDRARQAERIKALYQDGSNGLALGMLDADSVEDALWRLSVGRRVGEAVLRQANSDLRASQGAAVAAADRSVAADQAGATLATALSDLQEQTALADRALTQAQQQLASLSATARRLKAAEDAAAVLAAAQTTTETTSTSTGPITALGIPAEYEKYYRASANACTGLRWTLLAALGQVESGHGRNNGPSSAGAVGPMQFMPATFAHYAVDGNHDGRTDPWDPADAIPTAARYLCASGLNATDAGVRTALLAYNHAQWYVDLVLRTEQAIIEREKADSASTGTAADSVPITP